MDLGLKYASFEEGFDFVVEEAMEDLEDGEALLSGLGIPAGAVAHKDTNTCLNISHPLGPLRGQTFLGWRKSTKDRVRA